MYASPLSTHKKQKSLIPHVNSGLSLERARHVLEPMSQQRFSTSIKISVQALTLRFSAYGLHAAGGTCTACGVSWMNFSRVERARARSEPLLLRRRSEQAWRFRWGCLLAETFVADGVFMKWSASSTMWGLGYPEPSSASFSNVTFQKKRAPAYSKLRPSLTRGVFGWN